LAGPEGAKPKTLSKGRRIKTPVNRKTLTNISIVRYKVGGKRFEIACYPNKVEEWKRGIEKRIEEVLQLPEIYDNVSRGVVVNPIDLSNTFNTENKDEIIEIILEKGEIQNSELERKQTYDKMFKDIATIICDKCVNSENGAPLTRGVVEGAMRQIHYSVKIDKTAKQQALNVIKLLIESQIIPIERAKMLILLTTTISKLDELKQNFIDIIDIQEEKVTESNVTINALIIPSDFRIINTKSKNLGINLQVIEHSVKPEEDLNISTSSKNTENEDDGDED